MTLQTNSEQYEKTVFSRFVIPLHNSNDINFNSINRTFIIMDIAQRVQRDIDNINLTESTEIQKSKALKEIDDTKGTGYRTIFIRYDKVRSLLILCAGSGNQIGINKHGKFIHTQALLYKG